MGRLVNRPVTISHPVSRYGRVFKLTRRPTSDEANRVADVLTEGAEGLLKLIREGLEAETKAVFSLAKKPAVVSKIGEQASIRHTFRNGAPIVRFQASIVDGEGVRFLNRVLISVCTPGDAPSSPRHHSKCWSRIVLDHLEGNEVLDAAQWRTFRRAARTINERIVEKVLYPHYWRIIHDMVPSARFSNDEENATVPSAPPRDYQIVIDASNTSDRGICSLLREINISQLGLPSRELRRAHL